MMAQVQQSVFIVPGIYNFGNPLKCGKSSSLHIDERALSSNGFLFLLEARLECFDGPKIFTIEQSHLHAFHITQFFSRNQNSRSVNTFVCFCVC